MTHNQPSISEIKRRLNLDADTGIIVWRAIGQSAAGYDTKYAGHRAGRMGGRGYRRITILGADFVEHRVVWALIYGYWPCSEIDHINGDRADNRPCNLREATRAENMQNQCALRDSVSGHIGVDFVKHAKSWRARIKVKGIRFHIGFFKDRDLASAAYVEAKRSLHKFQRTARAA